MTTSLPRQNELVPISEAAKVLGVSIDTVRRWDKSGVLHSERLDGKNRYFSINELQQIKASQPLSISDVSKELGISATTLRRLENRGVIKPNRNSAGERMFDRDLITSFLNSDYYLRKGQVSTGTISVKKLVVEQPITQTEALPVENKFQPSVAEQPISQFATPIETMPVENKVSSSPEVTRSNKPSPYFRILKRVPGFLAAVIIFSLLTAIGITNIQASASEPTQPLSLHTIFSQAISPFTAEIWSETKPIPPSELIIEAVAAAPQPLPEKISETTVNPEIATVSAREAEKASSASAEQTKPQIYTVRLHNLDSSIVVRQTAATESAVKGLVTDGERFIPVSEKPGWYEVRLNDGSTGFISDNYVEPLEGKTNE